MRPILQCAHGRSGRDLRQRAADRADLLTVGAAGARQLGSDPESARPRRPGH